MVLGVLGTRKSTTPDMGDLRALDFIPPNLSSEGYKIARVRRETTYVPSSNKIALDRCSKVLAWSYFLLLVKVACFAVVQRKMFGEFLVHSQYTFFAFFVLLSMLPLAIPTIWIR